MNYYRRFPGDYLRDTMQLSLSEHGAYTLILDHMYATERPIKDLLEGYAICRANSELDQAAVRTIFDRYLRNTGRGFIQKKVKSEIAFLEDKRKQASMAGKASAAKRHENHKDKPQRPFNDRATGRSTTVQPSQTPDSRGQTGLRLEVSSSSISEASKESLGQQKPLTVLANGFETFWQAYPKKVHRKDAREVWQKTIGIDLHILDVLAGLEKWKITKQWQDPQYIPNPENFLSGRHWEDEITTGGNGNGVGNSQRDRRPTGAVPADPGKKYPTGTILKPTAVP